MDDAMTPGACAILPDVPLELRKVTLAPGDVLVVDVAGRIPAEISERIRFDVETKFPGHKCIVLDTGAKLRVISPAQADAERAAAKAAAFAELTDEVLILACAGGLSPNVARSIRRARDA